MNYHRQNNVTLPLLLILALLGFTQSPALARPDSIGAGHRGDCSQVQARIVDGRVFLEARDAPYGCVVKKILEGSNVRYRIWNPEDRLITISIKGAQVEDAIRLVCENYAIVYEFSKKTHEFRFAAVTLATSDKKDAYTGNDNREGADKAHKAYAAPAFFGDKAAPLPDYRKGEIVVWFAQGVEREKIDEINAFVGVKIKKKLSAKGIYKVHVDDDSRVSAIVALYKASGLVRAAEPNYLRYPQAEGNPDDPQLSNQWGLYAVEAFAAWGIEEGDPSVVVGVIDTGIDYMHPDLHDNIWINEAEKNGIEGKDDDGNGYIDDIYGYDFADNDVDPMDKAGHGTHVAGIIAAVTGNGQGIAGSAPGVRLMPLKVEPDSEEGFAEADIIEAMEYAQEKGVHIFNCSYGSSASSEIEYGIIQELVRYNTILVCAAGNDGLNNDLPENGNYPSDYDLDNIISVAASNDTGSLDSLSNYGKVSVDLMAPGVDILSAYPHSTDAKIIAGGGGTEIAANGFEFGGMTQPEGVYGILYDCGQGYPDQIPGAVDGNIALVQRGNRDGNDFYFYEKVANVQSQGAIGVIIYNNEAGDFSGTLITPGDWIPAVSVSDQAGETLLTYVQTGVTLVNAIDDDASYVFMSGTSMAAPFVSGLCSLIRSRRREMDYREVIGAVLASVDPVDGLEDMLSTGGSVNFYDALGLVLVPGDLNGDNKVGLDDLILSLKIMSGFTSEKIIFHPFAVPSAASSIPPSESLYILRKIAELN